MTAYYAPCVVCGRLVPRRGGSIDPVCSRLCESQRVEEPPAPAPRKPSRRRGRQVTIAEAIADGEASEGADSAPGGRT